MRELDKSKVYDLSELTSEELKELAIVTEKENQNKLYNKAVYWFKNYTDQGYKLFFDKINGWCFKYTTDGYVNAKELFYTLENIQADCRELTKEQVKEMADVFEANGFNVDKKELKVDDRYCYLCFVQYDVWVCDGFKSKQTITYEKFMELFGYKEKSEEFKNLVEVLNEELTEEAYKETDNKLNYELDFNFITQLAERMAQNKHKYEPYNWQKLDNIEDLKQALFRHVLEVMKGNCQDDNRLFGHLEAIALNVMFINHQLNKK